LQQYGCGTIILRHPDEAVFLDAAAKKEKVNE